MDINTKLHTYLLDLVHFQLSSLLGHPCKPQLISNKSAEKQRIF